MSSVDLAGLLKIDEDAKGHEAVKTWSELQSYYDDESAHLTRRELQHLGVGLADNPNPLEANILRRIVDRLATVYDRSPTRWLVRDRKRLGETSEEHQAMVEAYLRAKVDLALRQVDRRRALSRQEVVRYYPSDHRQSVVLRLFGPNQIARDPDPQEPDCLEADRRFALKLAGEVYEYWERNVDGWRMLRVSKSGEPLEVQPYGDTDGISPMGDILPVQLIHDDYPGGKAWLNPRASRKSWTVAINAVANDLWNMVNHQAHSTRVFNTDDPNASLPEVSGPNVTLKINSNDKITDITPNPKIKECQDFLEFILRTWSLSEDLPAEEFQPGRQVLTGAALKVLDRPLMARREAQIPLALEDERMGWRKFRAVHNLHASAWGRPQLAADTDLEVEIAEVDYPADGQAAVLEEESELKTNQKSVIDLIARKRNMPRSKAIATYDRVVSDNAAFPFSTVDAAPPERGTVGAQTEAILAVNDALALGKIARPTAVATLATIFGFDASTAEAMLNPEGFKPAPPPAAPGALADPEDDLAPEPVPA